MNCFFHLFPISNTFKQTNKLSKFARAVWQICPPLWPRTFHVSIPEPKNHQNLHKITNINLTLTLPVTCANFFAVTSSNLFLHSIKKCCFFEHIKSRNIRFPLSTTHNIHRRWKVTIFSMPEATSSIKSDIDVALHGCKMRLYNYFRSSKQWCTGTDHALINCSKLCNNHDNRVS